MPFRNYWNTDNIAVGYHYVSSGGEVSASKEIIEAGEGSREQVLWRVDERTGMV